MKLELKLDPDVGIEPGQIPEGAIIHFVPYEVDGIHAGYWVVDENDVALAVIPRTAIERGWDYSAALWLGDYQSWYDWDWERGDRPVTGLTEEEEDQILLAFTIDALREKGHDFDWDATWEDVAPFATDENGEWVGSTIRTAHSRWRGQPG
jgi:hypothetical protein